MGNAQTAETARSRTLFFLLLAAVAARAVLLFIAAPSLLSGRSVNAAMFPDGYDLIAWNLANGLGYRMFEDTSLTMLRTPGFVVVLAGVFSLFGKSLFPVQLLNFSLSILTAMVVFHLAFRILRSEVGGAIAALIVLLHPATIVADSRGGPETMLMLLMVLTLWLCFVALEKPQLYRFALLGLTFGAMMLVKSSVALILPAVAAWEVRKRWASENRRPIVSGFILAGAVSGLCLVPWVARNFEISGEFVPTMTVGGLAAFQGQHVVRNIFDGKEHWILLEEAAEQQKAIAGQMGLPTKGHMFQQFYSVKDEVSFYSELGQRAMSGYMESPVLVAKAVAYNFVAFWVQGQTAKVSAGFALIATPFLLLVVAGIRDAWREKGDISLFSLSTVCYMLPHLLIMSLARYSVPVLPVLSVVAAGGLLSLWPRLRELSGARRFPWKW
jgi:4-amino-4-deoxy-L-arabinose transferase-like glycosyltransferase